MFMAEVQIPAIGSVSKRCETLDEGINFLLHHINRHVNYKKAEVFCLNRNQTVVAFRVVP